MFKCLCNSNQKSVIINSSRETQEAREVRAHHTSFINSPVPLQIVDTSGIIIDVSPSWVKFFGYTSRDEIIGHLITEFRPPGSDVWADLDLAYFKEHGEIF